MSISRHLQAVACLLALALASCGGKKDTERETNAADSAGEVAETSSVSTPDVEASAGNTASAPVTRGDIDAWEKGVAGELKAVQQAGAKLKTARTGEDTLNAMMGVQEMNTISAGAQASGLDQERYKFVRSNLSAVVGYLTPALDTTMLSQAQRDELRQNNDNQLQQMQQDVPADVVEALRPRAAELRKKDLELTGARLKGAGLQ
jgi:type IV secretory pathway TrbL component